MIAGRPLSTHRSDSTHTAFRRKNGSELRAHSSANRRLAAGSTARTGTLFAAGLITGEALIGIFMAIPIVISDNPDVIALNIEWPSAAIPALIGLAVVLVVCATLYRVATRVSA